MSESAISEPQWVIYGMRHKDEPEYRYIGLTRVGIGRRLELHKNDAKRSTRHVSHWVRKNSEDIIIEVVEECPVGDEDYLFDAEVRWIKHYRDTGHQLTNLSDGGASGSYGARWTIPEEKRRSGENHPNYGKPMSDETKAAVRAAKTGSNRSLESRRKQGDSIRGENHWTARAGKSKNRFASNEIRIKKKRIIPSGPDHHAFGKPPVNKGIPMSEGQREKLRASAPRRSCKIWHGNRGYTDPECESCTQRVASGESERFSTPEEISTSKKMWLDARDPEEVARHREKMRKAQSNRPPVTDEHRAKLSAASKGRPGKKHSDETKAKMSAAKKGRQQTEAQKRGIMLSMHKKWHADRNITKPGCEYC